MKRTKSKKRTAVVRVLLIEPDEDTAIAVRDSLLSRYPRAQISICRDAATALQIVADEGAEFDVAVSSNRLADATGLELYNRLRGGNRGIPVVLLVDSGEEVEASAALLAGVEEVVVKDRAKGYLELLPASITKVKRDTEAATGGSSDRLAFIVQADPASREYKNAVIELRNTEPFWRAVVENPFEYVVILDKDAKIRYLNRTASGFEFDRVIGRARIYDFIDKAAHENVRKELNTVFLEGKAVYFETYAPDLKRWYSNTAGPLHKDGCIIGASLFARDITEQKSAESKLRESERRFRRFAEAVDEVFYILDPVERRAVYVSPAYEKVFGQSMNLVYANTMSWMDVVHPADRDWVQEDFALMIRNADDRYRGRAYRIIKPDGSVRWIQHRAYVIKGEAGGRWQIAGVATDVTAEKEAERKLRESEQKYRTLVDQASDGILLTDLEGRHLDANKAVCAMLGYTHDEMLNLSYRDTVVEEDLAKEPPRFDELERGGKLISERRLRRKDGSILYVEGSYKILPNRLLQVILRDVTERKRAEEELRRAHLDLERRVEERTRELEETVEVFDRAKRLASIGTLAAGIAHEINNPIGSILMAADTALYSLREPGQVEEAEEAIKSIKNDAKRAGQIVRTVLQLSRHEESQKWPNDLGDIARRARDITRRLATTRRVEVRLTVEDDLPEVNVNPTEIEQVFVNVLSNAIDASQPGQVVSVQLSSDAGSTKSVFEDRGRGMKEEEIVRIFDPFYTTRHSEGGTGLGLSLTHSIVNQHGGTIDVDSKSGKGTRITVMLPLRRDTGSDQ